MKSKTEYICQIKCVDKAKVIKITKLMPLQDELNTAVDILKSISDHTRFKILWALKDSELCVCDLSEILKMSLSAVSHQLRVLRNTGLVKYRNDGRMVYYSISRNSILSLINDAIKVSRKKD